MNVKNYFNLAVNVNKTVEVRRPGISHIITKRSMLLRTAFAHAYAQVQWTKSVTALVYNVRHELAINRGECSFSRNT